MGGIIAKKVSGKRYWLYEKYYTKEEALGKALEFKQKAKAQGKKMRTYIEEVEEFGDLAELFIPGTKWYLWLNEN